MSVLTVIAIVCFSVGSAAGFVGTLLGFMMTGEVNRKRGDGSQIPYFNWFPAKRMDIVTEYRRLYPEGRLHIYLIAAFAVMAIGVGGAFLCLCLMGVISPPPPSRPVTRGF